MRTQFSAPRCHASFNLAVVGIAIALVTIAPSPVARATVTALGTYRLGEADAGASVGAAGAPTTVDSSGNSNDLTESGTGPVYTAGIPSGSSLSLNFPSGAGNYARPAFGELFDNFGLEGWVHTNSVSDGAALVYNGATFGNGFGFRVWSNNSPTGHPVYEGQFGGARVLPTNVDATAGDNVYIALVENGGVPTVYISPNGGALQSFTFSAGGPVGDVSGFTFAIGNGFDGAFDEVRLFTFAAGAFSTNDLLINSLPEPGSFAVLSLAAGTLLLRRRRR